MLAQSALEYLSEWCDQRTQSKKANNIPEILPPAIPPLKVGRPCAAGNGNGPGFVTLKVWLIGYALVVVDARVGVGEEL